MVSWRNRGTDENTSGRSRIAWLLGRGNIPADRESFFAWQERALSLLLSWGIGNVAAGTFVALTRSGIPRWIGVQAIAWGSVDAAIALYAQCVARKQALQVRSGLMGARHVQDSAERFEHFLMLNTLVDVVYVLVGTVGVVKARSDWLRGTSIGVLIQGGALLVYDLALMLRVIARPETHHHEPSISG